MRLAAVGAAASARRRRRSHARAFSALSGASAAVEQPEGAAASEAGSPFTGASSQALLYALAGASARRALAFPRVEIRRTPRARG